MHHPGVQGGRQMCAGAFECESAEAYTMRSAAPNSFRCIFAILALVVFILFGAGPFGIAHADPYPLVPNTKLRVSVTQWNPAKGEYVRLDALSGEFTVSEAGTVLLPLVGSVPVREFNSVDFAAEFAKRLQAKIKLISVPDVSVEVVDYPPIYVVGQVATPGEYRFRPGMSLLQAFALAGGRYRLPNLNNPLAGGQTGLFSDLESLRGDQLRAKAQIARLRAEMSGLKEIQFPMDLTEDGGSDDLPRILEREKVIFSARRNALDRQLATLAELRDLYSEEIRTIEEKGRRDDERINSAEQELDHLRPLLNKGILTVSFRKDIEREISGLRSSKLDQITALMRARQNFAEVMRSSVGLRDQQLTTAATELQAAEANLNHLQIRSEASRRLLLEVGGAERGGKESSLVFTIVRKTADRITETVGSESTILFPGDVVKVTDIMPPERTTSR